LGSFSPVTNACVEYNGYYSCKIDKENFAIIRFYDDGTVIASTTNNDPQTILLWFKKEHQDMVLTGKCKFKKCHSSFTLKGDSGSQQFKVQAAMNAIDVEISDTHSHLAVHRTYLFVSE
jgi:hypothetical protein